MKKNIILYSITLFLFWCSQSNQSNDDFIGDCVIFNYIKYDKKEAFENLDDEDWTDAEEVETFEDAYEEEEPEMEMDDDEGMEDDDEEGDDEAEEMDENMDHPNCFGVQKRWVVSKFFKRMRSVHFCKKQPWGIQIS